MSAPRRSSEGCGEWSASWPSGRRMPSSGASRSAPRGPWPRPRPARRPRRRGRGRARARRAGLHDHDGDRVRDDVVQLARDPHALARHRVALALASRSRSSCSVRAVSSAVSRARPRAEAPQGPAAARRGRRARRCRRPRGDRSWRRDDDDQREDAREPGLRAPPRQVRADREAQDRDEDRRRRQVLRRGLRARARSRRRPSTGEHPERRGAAPGQRRAQARAQQQGAQSGVSRTAESMSSSSTAAPSAAASTSVGALGARDPHARGSPMGRRALQLEAARRAAAGVQLAAVERDALAQAEEPAAVVHGPSPRASSVTSSSTAAGS